MNQNKDSHEPIDQKPSHIEEGVVTALDNMAAIVLLILQAIIINRLAGIPYPLWKAKSGKKQADTGLPGGSQAS